MSIELLPATTTGTVFGRATIITPARHSDNIIECQLTSWTLANGKHPTVFCVSSFLTTTSSSTTPTPTPTTNKEITADATTGSSKQSIPSFTAELPEVSARPRRETVHDATPLVGGEAVIFYNDHYFSKLRKRFDIPADVVQDVTQFSWNKMKPSEGKGGDAMQFTPCRKYIVKELGSDHDALLAITKEYVEHICGGTSLLVRFAMHFKRLSDEKNYVLMNSWLPKPEGPSSKCKEDQFYQIYDLKGCADDKMMHTNFNRLDQIHARCWDCKTSCFPNAERKLYKTGKVYARTCNFHLHHIERERVMTKINRDATFLKRIGLMDYSLIVGIKQCSSQTYQDKMLPLGGFSPGDIHGKDQAQPYLSVQNDTVVAYYIGIIDFLQFYGCGKSIAHYIKCCDVKPLATVPPATYGTRFADYFNQKFQVINTDSPSWLHVQTETHSSDVNVGMSK